MKNITVKITALVSVFFVIWGVISVRPSISQDAATLTAIVELVDKIDKLDFGDLSCVTLLGPNDCSSFKRCQNGLGHVRALRNGLPSAANNFEAWMAESSMQRNCGHALLGGNISRFNELYGALVDNVQNCCNGNWTLADQRVIDRRTHPEPLIFMEGDFTKNGNNGTVSCNTFCGSQNGHQIVWGDRIGYCVGARNEHTGDVVSCDTAVGLIPEGKQLTCACKNGAFVKHGNNGTVSCDTFCSGSQWAGGVGSCVAAVNTKNGNRESCGTTPGFLDGPELTCTCRH